MLGDTFWPLFGNLGLLFCVGISYGLAKDKKTEVALVSVMCFIMFLGANHSGWNTPTDSPKKLTVNIMAPGKPSCWALWWWIWAFSWHYSRLHHRVGAQ
jgi:phosphotransferase system  glucose/maltose/N-acetylglucosamine-specific IIC component